jgi:ammonium transporter, Amt family
MENANLLNLLWLLVCAGQVMMMQAGFCLLECGTSRAKNSINVAAKNLIDFCVAGLVFWVFGFGLMFGESWFGLTGATFFCLEGITSSKLLTFFFFQLVFCGTATTIISGAVAERIHLRAYLLVSVLVSGLIYPIFGHWAWGGVIEGTSGGWLAKLGFVDFAGSTVVHSIGGWVALACVMVIGPRLGRFGRNGRPIPGHDLPMMVVGTLLLWFGWFGFNGGSTLAFNDKVPLILVNTVLAGASGGVAAMFVSQFLTGRLDIQQLSNGILAGLVSITASCNAVTPLQSIVIGIVGGLLCSAFTELLIKVKIDDVVAAVPTHAVSGVWGTLAVACFADPSTWPIPRDRLTQFSIQSMGCLVAFVWAFGTSFVLLTLVSRVWKLRVTPKQERLGLNIVEHGAGTEVTALLRQMQNHRRDGNFHRLVSVEPFTEVGQIATVYNRVLKSVGFEITKRKKAEQQYRDIYENAVEGIFQSSLDGRFLSANSSLIRTYGYTSFEEMKEKLSSIEQSLYVLPNRRQEFLNLMEQQDVLNDFRSQVYRADGSVIWISETVRCVRDSIGKLKYFEGTVVDITHRMETERLLYEMAQTQAANKAKTEFLANLSHEIRTPLSGVISMLGLMSDSKSEHERQHYLQIAQQSSTTLLALINDVLDLSKVEAGRMELEAIEFDLEALLEETVEMLYYRAREKNLRLVFNLAPEVPLRLRGDSMKIKQVIINLVGNAIKFTETGHVRIDVCQSANALKNGFLRFSVTDTGIGIADDRKQAIFQPFTQADASTTRKYGGTGLGLTISERIVTAMKGSIGVESELGVGSVFSFEVPLEVVDSTRISRRDNITNKRILLIADPNIESSFIADKLRYFGANATICEPKNLARLLEPGRLKNAPYELLLIDGESCDAELALVAKRLQPDAKLILIGSAPDATAFDEQLMKPVRSSTLRNAIEKNSNSPSSCNATKTEATSRSDEDELFGSNREILIVDDNDVNRLIASEVVRRMGFIPTAVSSGAEAIEACTSKVFAGVLVDCEMPEMDGHQTTQRLRQRHTAGSLALPSDTKLVIIALTAQVVAESRARCLESGMDDYLTKPIDRKVFAEVLLRHLGRSSETAVIPPVLVTEPSLAAIDEPPIRWSEALDRCGGRPEALRLVLKMFSDKSKAQIDKMKSFSEAGNFGDLARSAHALRGSAGNLSAYRVSSIAETIEVHSRIEEPQVVERSLRQLEAEMDRCISWIQERLEEVV